ncbi:MAG: thiamine-phosphate kinase [Nitratireductor sp.]
MGSQTDHNSRPGEFEIIARYFAPLAGSAGAFGLRDDAALLDVTPGARLVVTQDAVAAGIHFFADDPPELVAKKALRVNLSDLSAKGARPTGFSLALGLWDGWDENWLARFASGLGEDCREFEITLTGGDTYRSPGALVISITAFGEITDGNYTSRLGASVGDVLFVTGTIGDAALGLKVRLGELTAGEPATDHLRNAYWLPNPPVSFAPLIARHASASMDISDGFVGDLRKLAVASGVGFEVAAGDVPLSPAVEALCSQDRRLLVSALTGGDDYQFLVTVPQSRVALFLEEAQKSAVQVSRLATASANAGKLSIVGADGAPMQFPGESWNHY